MPRLTPCRSVIALVLVCISILLTFMTLPSPRYSDIERTEIIQNTLRSGGTLKTIHENDGIFERDIGAPTESDDDDQNAGIDSSGATATTLSSAAITTNVTDTEKGTEVEDPDNADNGDDESGDEYRYQPFSGSDVLIDWRLERCTKTNSILLRLGRPRASTMYGSGKSKPATFINLTHEVAMSSRRIGRPREVMVRMTDTGPENEFPYFDRADLAMISDYYDPKTDVPIYLRVLAKGTDQVQLWKNVPGWRTNSTGWLGLNDADRKLGLLATFSGIPTVTDPTRADFSQLMVSDITGLLPTKTFPIRMALFKVIIPLAYLVRVTLEILVGIIYFVFQVLFGFMNFVAAYFMIVMVVWIFKGRPAFVEWTKTYWLTRWVYRALNPNEDHRKSRLWSAAGPVEDAEGDESEWDRPTPLRNPIDFFRSRAPLNDLLYTFESTRWMLRPLPLGRRNGNVHLGDEDTQGQPPRTVTVDGSVPSDDTKRVRITV